MFTWCLILEKPMWDLFSQWKFNKEVQETLPYLRRASLVTLVDCYMILEITDWPKCTCFLLLQHSNFMTLLRVILCFLPLQYWGMIFFVFYWTFAVLWMEWLTFGKFKQKGNFLFPHEGNSISSLLSFCISFWVLELLPEARNSR